MKVTKYQRHTQKAILTNNEIQQRVISAIVKVQSALHDLGELPLQSDFTKQLKQEQNDFLELARDHITRTEIQLNGITKLMNYEASDTYSEIVSKFDKLGKEIKYVDVE